MTVALDRTRALLNQPPAVPIPGQLDLTRSDMTQQPETQAPETQGRSIRPVIEHALTNYGYSPETARILIDQLVAEARAE